MNLSKRTRTRRFLHHAWMQVRTSGLSSGSEGTKKSILQFEADWINKIQRIQEQLREKRFVFVGDNGHTPPKGKGKKGIRPIVVGSVENRIVRRAILDVLQGEDLDESLEDRWPGVPAILDVMMTPTSVGGIRGRGVPHGIALVNSALTNGNAWYIRSDIKDFFTRIPKQRVHDFVRGAADDEDFVDLFISALETNLENQGELEERNLFKLFPDESTGVAQGSALSALAGNIALREFDKEMNSRGLICVRYIDDFILLGKSETSVRRGYAAAREILSGIGMDVYDLEDFGARKAGKVDTGNIFNGTEFLGYKISGFSRQPCNAARQKFSDKLNALVKEAKKAMREARRGDALNPKFAHYQSMVKLHGLVWGWSQAFKHTTARHVFVQLDGEIDRAMAEITTDAQCIIRVGLPETRRRVLGVHLLADTPSAPLPDVQQEFPANTQPSGAWVAQSKRYRLQLEGNKVVDLCRPPR